MPEEKKNFKDHQDYKPIDNWAMVSGGRIGRDRIRQLVELEFEGYEDISADDVVAACSERYKRTFYAFAEAAESLWGEEMALQLFDQMGYMMGVRKWKSVQKRYGAKKITPAQIAWFQDMGHLFYGPGTKAYSQCDGDKCVCTRHDCLFKRPEGLGDKAKYCETFDRAYIRGYMDVQPGLVCTLHTFLQPEELPIDAAVKSFPTYKGGTICQHVWRYGTEQERVAARETPMSNRRSDGKPLHN